MRYSICGAVKEIDVHALFHCPLASSIWEGTKFSALVESIHKGMIWDVVFHAKKKLDEDAWAEFITIA